MLNLNQEVNDSRITAKEACILLQCGKTTFYKLTKKKELLTPIPNGRRKKYSFNEVRALALKGWY